MSAEERWDKRMRIVGAFVVALHIGLAVTYLIN